MNLLRARLRVLGLLACTTALVGCPSIIPTPELSVSPMALNFGSDSDTETFAIANVGSGTLSWTIEAVEDSSGSEDWVPADLDWLTVETLNGDTTAEVDHITLTADRTGMTGGTVSNTGVRVVSNGGTAVVRVTITVPSLLSVSPSNIGVPPPDVTSGSDQVTIRNQGPVSQDWRIDYLPNPNDPDSTAAFPGWLTVDPSEGRLRAGEEVDVEIRWEGWGGGEFALLVTLGAETAVVRVGEMDLEVTPSTLVFYGLGDTATLSIENNGTSDVGWRITLQNVAEPGEDVPVSVDTQAGTTKPGEESTVGVTVDETDAENVLFGEGYYELWVETSAGTLTVPILIEALALPVILVSEPPDPELVQPPPVDIRDLDFGTEAYQEEFYIGNLGPVGSTLYFRITHEDEEAAEPLIDSIVPNQGSTECAEDVFYVAEWGEWLCGIPITVTINRNNIREDIEYRTITITAWDSDFQGPLDAIEPVEVNVRVERPPIRFEGAQHRSRPPFMLRFVFLLRDALGEAIDTRSPEIFAELQNAFTVFEDDVLLPEETNYFVTYAEDLRYDLVLLLDYTGSMFEAARSHALYADSAEPLRELYTGAVGDPDDEGLVGTFIRELPESYQVALMEYHDRQQERRLIHRFSTSKDSLITGLKGFSLPEGAHGVSELYDALEEACQRLADKDRDSEPFLTDADVRGIIFISDGKDTSSSATVSDVISLAQELGVRLYPIAFGEDANNGPLIALATETGGHFYQAKTVSGADRCTLYSLLVHDPIDTEPNAPGKIVTELDRQIVLTYVSPIPASTGGHSYRLRVDYNGEWGEVENDMLSEDNFMAAGDVRAGQISLSTSGISESTLGDGSVERVAEVYVRAEYVPRDVSQFRFRIVTDPEIALTEDNIELVGLLAGAEGATEPWRPLDEGTNIFRLITHETNFLPYGSFGNLMRITFEGVTQDFEVGIRVDNSVYGPPSNSFMQFPLENLLVSEQPDIVAVPLADIKLIEDDFVPTAPGAFDTDGDGTRDFDDPEPLNPDLPPFLIAPRLIDFGSTETSATAELYNGRFDDLSWSISGTVPGLGFSAGVEGPQTLQVGALQPLTLTLDRDVYAPGSYSRTFTLVATNAVSVSVSADRIEVSVAFTVPPSLEIGPAQLEALSFPSWVSESEFTIENVGDGDFDWEIAVLDPAHPDTTTPPAFMTFTPPFTGDPPGLTGTTPAGGQTTITVVIDRDHPDLAEYGEYTYTVVVTAATPDGAEPATTAISRGTVSIPVEIIVVGMPELHVLSEGVEVDLETGLWMLTGEEELALTLLNLGDEALPWSMSLRYLDDLSVAAEGLSIEITPAEGTIPAGEYTAVLIEVDQTALIEVLEDGNHAFLLSIARDQGGLDPIVLMDIPLTINLEPLPEIETVKPPDPNLANPPVEYLDTLDFETEEYQMVFHVANVGHQDSELYFRVEHDDQYSTSPLIADVRPMEGSPENDPNAFYFRIDNKAVATLPVMVTIDRNNIEGEVDERTITLVSMDSTFSRELRAVDRHEVTVRVERPPLQIEGAQNRSRPPFMLRFVFLLRDAFGNAIDTLDPVIFAQLQDAFTVKEDDQLLPADETNHFVTYAKDLRYDLVILLDYTGSMYQAAREEFPSSPDPLQQLYAGAPDDPADEGAAGAFIRDLPDSYNIALMEYHDRQQVTEYHDRLIHGFHTDDDALIASLQEFSVPAGHHGASEIYDALIDACQRLAEKDGDALPLVEDADVRAVVFISDGWDTSSEATVANVIALAQELRVRLYPIGFGEDVNLFDLIQLATETGGHFYRARQVQDYAMQDLMDLLALDTQSEDENAPGRVAAELARQIVLTYITLMPGAHTYQIRVDYQDDFGFFQQAGVMMGGDVRAGQVSLSTTGICGDTAEVYVRAEYVPRNTSQFRFRLVPSSGITLTANDIELAGLLADDGIPPDDWRLIDEGNNIFSVVTDEGNFLPYGSFGDLLRITLEGLAGDELELGIRVDNSVYFNPPNTTFFQYPLTNLVIAADAPDIVAVALEDIYMVEDGFNPDAPGAFDADGDGTRDFDDPEPLNAEVPPPFADPVAIDFGSEDTTALIALTNERFESLEWVLSNPITWLTPSPTSGSLPVGGEDTVTLIADRAGLTTSGVHTDAFSFELRAAGGMSVERIEVCVSITVPPALRITPETVTFPAVCSESVFDIENVGTTPFDWTIEAVNPANPSQVIPLPALFTIEPAMTGTTTDGGESPITMRVDRSGLDLGAYDYMLRVTTTPDFGAQFVPVQVVVAGTPILEVDEGDEVWMLIGEETAELTLRNTGDDVLNWSIELFHTPEEGLSLPIETLPITTAPCEGTIPPASSEGTIPAPSVVTITVDQMNLLDVLGEGEHRFRISIPWGRDTTTIWLYIDLAPMPSIVVDRETLDFGTDPDTLELQFGVGNPGAMYSKLNYAFEVLGEDNANTPLITNIFNEEESSTGVLWRTDPVYYPTDLITVSIDRSVLDERVEYRTIRVYDTEIAAVEPVDVTVRVEQTPLTIEGAINRSRPPFVMRFVFLLRDMLGQAIPTTMEEDLAKLDFFVEEDGVQLDPNETNHFITGPENLKCNLVLLLDFTGSMYKAGVDDEASPLEPGQAIEQMVEAAKGFIDDLPDGYRVSIMEYHDRQQGNRLIHAFSTDKESLKHALDAFSLPAQDHGASEILDALVNACNLLIAEDPLETIPFDDADVRAVVFVSDGWDTSSVSTVTDTVQHAKDSRVRYYPVGFSGGENVNNGALVELATGTGGHVYYAPSVESLEELLANEMGLALSDDEDNVDGLEATFKLCNVGTQALPWTLEYDADSWLSVDLPHSGAVLPGECHRVSLEVDDTGLGAGTHSEDIQITSQTTLTRGGTTETVTLNATVTVTLKVEVGEPSELSLSLSDEHGRIWRELRNQLVLTYISLVQEGTHAYLVRADYMPEGPEGDVYSGEFEEDGVYWFGDVRQGQISLWTTGINWDATAGEYRAKAYVRTDYVPRNISQFKFRFFVTFTAPDDVPEATLVEILAELPDIAEATVELAPDGLITDWRLIPQGDGAYTVLTEQSNALQYGAFGNLLTLTFEDLNSFVDAFTGLTDEAYFELGFRVDNGLYYCPAVPPSTPSTTKYFVYPGAYLNQGRRLIIGMGSDIATPAANPLDLTVTGFDPEAPFAWDDDEDGVTDFDDPDPFDGEVPTPFLAPHTLTIGATTDTAAFTIRNNRLDTFSWSIQDPIEDPLPEWVTQIDPMGATLPPGDEIEVIVTVDRGGLTPGLYDGRIAILTDLADFGRETKDTVTLYMTVSGE